MDKTYEKVSQEKQTGYRIVLKGSSRYSSVELPYETMYIDMNGDVMYIDHDSSCSAGGGFCTFRRGELNFRENVRAFMEQLLKQNVEEFRNMRNVLTGEWHKMAETVRKNAVSKYNF